MGRLLYFVTTIVIAGIMLAGCPLGPHSRLYKPMSDWGRDAFKKANREIFPDDVRNDFLNHDSSRIAWPGIVLNVAFDRQGDTLLAHFEVEHHYYD